MSISIVTAFFDIGRGDWHTGTTYHPHLKRTTATYFRRFSYMAALENEMVIFTSSDLVQRVARLRKGRPGKIIAVDFPGEFIELRNRIQEVQQDAGYRAQIDPAQLVNPEYWSPDYVLVNLLKSTFLRRAIASGHVSHDLVAWLDFGYCRKRSTLAHTACWNHDFDPSKVHLFSLRPWTHPFPNATPESIVQEKLLQDCMSHNEVYIIGPSIVAGKAAWSHLDALYQSVIRALLANHWIDDDQSLFLMCSLLEPERFTIHQPPDWFCIFSDFGNRSRKLKPVEAFGALLRNWFLRLA